MKNSKSIRCKNEDLKGTALKRLAQEQKEAIENGSKTLNQVRKEYGLEPTEGGDKLYHKIIL
ncbi:hypothetical protein QJR26_08825 [Clostridium baratii]